MLGVKKRHSQFKEVFWLRKVRETVFIHNHISRASVSVQRDTTSEEKCGDYRDMASSQGVLSEG